MPSWYICGNERFRGPVFPGTSVVSNWTPADFGANLVAWYKADVGVTGNPVTQVLDQSGNGYTLINSGTIALNATGINGFKAFEFIAATPGHLTTNTETMVINSSSYTFYAVVVLRTNALINARALALAAPGGIDTGAGGIIPILRDGTNNGMCGFHGAGGFFGIRSATLGTVYRAGCVSNGTTIDAYQNGVIVGTSQTASDVIANVAAIFNVGDNSAADSSWDGFIGEVVITKTNNATEISAGGNLDNYFKTRFGL